MNNPLKSIQRLLNLKVQKNQGLLLACSTVTGFLFCYISPRVEKEIISSLPAEFLSVQSLWWCLSALLIGIVWKGTTRETAIKYFTVLALTESFMGFCLGMYLVFVEYNVWVFAIGSLLYSSMVSIFVGKCIMCFESKLWQNREREDFDNTNSIVRGIVNCLGFGIAIFAMPPIKVAVFIWGVTCVIDDIGWIIIYNRCRKQIMEKPAEDYSPSETSNSSPSS